MADERLEILVTARDAATNVFNKIGQGLGSVFKIGALATTVASGALAVFVGKAVEAASSLSESQNKVNVVFGQSAAVVSSFARQAAGSLGQSEQQALEAAGTFGNLFTSMGMGQQTSADMSVGLVKLASDLASFNNIDPAIALEKLRSGLVGETEPLRTLGVNLSAAAVQQKALDMGLAKTAKSLTPAALAQARYALILEQTKNAQGDFARTSDGLANSQRIVKAQIADLTSKLGGIFLPVAVKVFGFLGKTAVPFLGGMVDKLKILSGALPRAFEFLQKGEIGNAFNYLVLTFRELLGPELTGKLIGFGNMLQEVFSQAQPVINGVVGFLQEKIPLVAAFLEGMRPAVEQVFGKIVSFGQEIVAKVGPFLVTAFMKLSDWFTANGPLIQEILTKLGDKVSVVIAAVTTGFSGFWDWISPLLQDLIDFILSIGTAILQLANGDWQGALNTMKAAFEKLWEGIKATWETFRVWFEGVWSKLVEWFKGVDWESIGRAVLGGIWNGISNGWEWLKARLSEWVGNFLAYVRGLLGIRSPSTVFAAIGQQMMAGMAEGISGSIKPRLAVSGMVAQTVGAAGGGRAMGDSIVIQYNILNLSSSARTERVADDFALASAWSR